MTTDLNTLTTAELNAEIQRRQKEVQTKLYQEQLEKQRKEKEQAEVGKKEALIEVESLKTLINTSFDRIQQLAQKHHLYVEFDWGSGSLEISRWGRDVSGWDSSNC